MLTTLVNAVKNFMKKFSSKKEKVEKQLATLPVVEDDIKLVSAIVENPEKTGEITDVTVVQEDYGTSATITREGEKGATREVSKAEVDFFGKTNSLSITTSAEGYKEADSYTEMNIMDDTLITYTSTEKVLGSERITEVTMGSLSKNEDEFSYSKATAFQYSGLKGTYSSSIVVENTTQDGYESIKVENTELEETSTEKHEFEHVETTVLEDGTLTQMETQTDYVATKSKETRESEWAEIVEDQSNNYYSEILGNSSYTKTSSKTEEYFYQSTETNDDGKRSWIVESSDRTATKSKETFSSNFYSTFEDEKEDIYSEILNNYYNETSSSKTIENSYFSSYTNDGDTINEVVETSNFLQTKSKEVSDYSRSETFEEEDYLSETYVSNSRQETSSKLETHDVVTNSVSDHGITNSKSEYSDYTKTKSKETFSYSVYENYEEENYSLSSYSNHYTEETKTKFYVYDTNGRTEVEDENYYAQEESYEGTFYSTRSVETWNTWESDWDSEHDRSFNQEVERTLKFASDYESVRVSSSLSYDGDGDWSNGIDYTITCELVMTSKKGKVTMSSSISADFNAEFGSDLYDQYMSDLVYVSDVTRDAGDEKFSASINK